VGHDVHGREIAPARKCGGHLPRRRAHAIKQHGVHARPQLSQDRLDIPDVGVDEQDFEPNGH
jgi:hypothetical protein